MAMSFRKRVVFLAAAVSTGALAMTAAAAARGHDFIRDSIPQKWVEPFIPEKLPELTYPAYFDDLDKAKAQAHAGRYKTALVTLRKVTNPKPEQLITIAMVRGKSLAEVGRVDEALSALSDQTKAKVPGKGEIAIADAQPVQILKAQVLADAGRPEEAIALLKAHLKAYPDSWGGHYLLGEYLERIGDVEHAKEQYAWFVDPARDFLGKWEARERIPEFESAENVTWLGHAADRWATLFGKYAGNTALPKVILNTFVKASTIDVDYWPAHVAAAEYYLDHDDRQQAAGELKQALAANPQDIRALNLMGKIGLDTFNFDQVDAIVLAMRELNSDSHVADLLEARNLLLQRRPKDAETPVQRVLSAQPHNMEAMGLLAAVYALQLHEDQADQILKQVDAIDVSHKNARAYLEVAEQLSAMRQYPRAAAKYQVAIERAPWWTAARNGLGLLYTQSGDEDKAYATLEEARKLDPFNVATTNYMRLLDMMLSFQKVETPHFVLMFDPVKDPIIPEYFTDYLESINAAVCGDFKFQPAVKTYIEVFPSHEAFSVRTTGSPWIGTVGASTGRVIAMVSPRKGGPEMGPFNWSQVLRHEYTHTVTLGMTDNRIQHWFTEGLAVWEEHTPLRWEWVPMLYNAVKKHELFTMDNLTWGFVRPKRPIDRQLAYAQSLWICTYIEEAYGHDAILKMLEMFKNAGRQEDVFPAVTGKPMDVFYADFLAWCDKQVATWGYDKETSEKAKALSEKAESAKDAHQYDEAIKLWEEYLTLRPVDALPHQRLAGLYLQAGQSDKAVEHLIVLQKVELKDNRYAKMIARIYKKEKRWKEAAKFALDAVYIDPYDLSAHELLQEVDQATGNTKGLEREDRVIPLLTKWIEDQRKANDVHPQR